MIPDHNKRQSANRVLNSCGTFNETRVLSWYQLLNYLTTTTSGAPNGDRGSTMTTLGSPYTTFFFELSHHSIKNDFNFNPRMGSNYIHRKSEKKLIIHSQTSTVAPSKFGWVITSHPLLDMWLRIHDGI